MQADGVDSIIVEVRRERLVPRIPEVEVEVSRAEPSVVRAELVDHEDASLARSVDRHGVATVPVEVASKRDVTRVAEEEPDVGGSLRVRVPKVHVPVRLPVKPWRVDPIAVPVAHDRVVARVSEEEARG